MLDHIRQDLRDAVRNLRRYPLAAAVAMVSLAFGLGATTTTLIVRDVLFRKAPPLYRAPEQLTMLHLGRRDEPVNRVGHPIPGALYAAWRDSGLAMAAAAPSRARQVRTADRSELLPVRAVTADLFPLLGVDPARGRAFSPTDAQSAGPTPAVLSHRVWQRLFDGSPDAVGVSVWIDDRPYVVTGVMPERFWFWEMDAPIWIPLDRAAAAAETGLQVVVRRADDSGAASLARQLEPAAAEYVKRLPPQDRQQSVRVSSVAGTPMGRAMSLVIPWLFGASVLLTLVIACANVAIIAIAQWTSRERDIAIRAALGASRGRIVRALVTESLVMAAAGGVLGIGAALALRAVVARNAGPLLMRFDLSIDASIFVEAIAITLATGLAAGVAPALLETRRLLGNPMTALATSERVRQRWRHALVVLEITLTVALLVVTGSMLNAYRRQMSEDLGYSTHPLFVARIERAGGVDVDRVLSVVAQLPGVNGAAASTTVPYMASGAPERVSADSDGAAAIRVERAVIGPGFFDVLGVTMRAGRAFTRQDSPAARTAIVSEALARRLFGGPDAIGRRVLVDGVAHDIVGVVSNYRNAALQSRGLDARLYLPLDATANPRQQTFLVRATGHPALVLTALRRTIRSAGPGYVVAQGFTLDEIVTVAGQEMLAGTAPLAPLVLIGLLLTAAGIYGVLAFAIARRSKELAVRIAIGATGADLIRLVAMYSARLAAIGLSCGIGVTFALSRIVRASGGEGSILDPEWTAFAIPVFVIAGTALLASWVPWRRAIRIDPAVELRT